METYRPASKIREGDYIWHNEDGWQQITSLVQVTSPAKFAMVVLANGYDISIPHTHEVNYRTAVQMAAERDESRCEDCDSDFGPCDPHARKADAVDQAAADAA